MSEVSSLPILRLRWQLQYTQCNLKCPYCIAAWTKRPVEFQAERFSRLVDRLLDLPYRLVVRLGVEGEIFLSPEIQEGVARLSRSPKTEGVSFSTNLVAPWGTISSFLDRADTAKVGMGATLHDTQIADAEGFFEKVAKVQARGVLLFIGYVGLPDRFEQIAAYKKRLDSMGVPFILNEYNGTIEDVPFPKAYTAQQRAFLREHFFTDHYFRMLVERESPKGQPCLAGHRYLYMDTRGDLFACGMDRNPDWTLGQKVAWRVSQPWATEIQKRRKERNRLGNLLDGDPALALGPRPCPHGVCACGNEVQAMARVGREYHRTRTLRVIYPKARAEECERRYPNLRPIENDPM
jgi:pyruvate-formate lyase-activating enzyme